MARTRSDTSESFCGRVVPLRVGRTGALAGRLPRQRRGVSADPVRASLRARDNAGTPGRGRSRRSTPDRPALLVGRRACRARRPARARRSQASRARCRACDPAPDLVLRQLQRGLVRVDDRNRRASPPSRRRTNPVRRHPRCCRRRHGSARRRRPRRNPSSTGPTAVSHGELADALATALRRPIRYRSVPNEEFIRLLVNRGFGLDHARFLAQALRDVAENRLAIPVFDTVERVCGRRAYDVHEFARHFADS